MCWTTEAKARVPSNRKHWTLRPTLTDILTRFLSFLVLALFIEGLFFDTPLNGLFTYRFEPPTNTVMANETRCYISEAVSIADSHTELICPFINEAHRFLFHKPISTWQQLPKESGLEPGCRLSQSPKLHRRAPELHPDALLQVFPTFEDTRIDGVRRNEHDAVQIGSGSVISQCLIRQMRALALDLQTSQTFSQFRATADKLLRLSVEMKVAVASAEHRGKCEFAVN